MIKIIDLTQANHCKSVQGYGRKISRKLWEAGGNTDLDLSKIPRDQQTPEHQPPNAEDETAPRLQTNLWDVYAADGVLAEAHLDRWQL